MTFTIQTTKPKEVIDITEHAQKQVSEERVRRGLCNIYILHTTTAISMGDLDPGTDLDYLDAFTTMIPKLAYRHPHNPTHVSDHILATLIGPSVTVPINFTMTNQPTWPIKIPLFRGNFISSL